MKNLIAVALLLFMATTTIDAQIVNRFRDSTVFFNKVQFDSNIRITQGASNGKVLTSDANGFATWQAGGGGGSAWSLTGNAGTEYETNFLGTTDSVGLVIKADAKNNKEAGVDIRAFSALDAGLKIEAYSNLNQGFAITAGSDSSEAARIVTRGNSNEQAFLIQGENNGDGADVRIHSYNGKLRLTGIGNETPGNYLVCDQGGIAVWKSPDSISLYKKYVALLTQTDTFPPIATVLENSLDESVVWSRVGQGVYRGSCLGCFVDNKTVTFITNNSAGDGDSNAIIGGGQSPAESEDYVSIWTTTGTDPVPTDGRLVNASIEIRVYK